MSLLATAAFNTSAATRTGVTRRAYTIAAPINNGDTVNITDFPTRVVDAIFVAETELSGMRQGHIVTLSGTGPKTVATFIVSDGWATKPGGTLIVDGL